MFYSYSVFYVDIFKNILVGHFYKKCQFCLFHVYILHFKKLRCKKILEVEPGFFQNSSYFSYGVFVRFAKKITKVRLRTTSTSVLKSCPFLGIFLTASMGLFLIHGPPFKSAINHKKINIFDIFHIIKKLIFLIIYIFMYYIFIYIS